MNDRSLLERLLARILDAPRATVGISALVVLLAAVLGWGVEFRTSRAELAPAGDPDQARWDELLADYPASDQLIALIERTDGNATPAAARDFADALAAAWEAEPHVDRVFYRLDVDWLERNLPFLAPPEAIDALLAVWDEAPELVAAMQGLSNLTELDEVLAAVLEAGAAGGLRRPDEPEAPDALAWIAQYLEFRRESIESGSLSSRQLSEFRWLSLARDRLPSADGYLSTQDGEFLIMLIAPASIDDSLAARRSLVSAIRGHAASIAAEHPGLQVGLTGQPAIVVDEMDAVRRDTWFTSAIAVLGVGLLIGLVFRWKSHAVWVLLALGCGIVAALGAVRLELGYLNLITSSFVSTLIGVGVAYGIHPISEYELLGAHAVDPRSTLAEAYRRTADAVIVAGVTTSAAFFSILLMQFRGFAELGLVAGVGVLLCLAAAVTVLPALVLLHGTRRRRAAAVVARGSAIDSIWVDRFSRHVCRAPRLTVTIALLATAAGIWAASDAGFDTNIMKLLPRRAESLQLQERIASKSDVTPLFNIVVADNLEQLQAMEARAAAEPAIASFQSVLQFLPADPRQTRARTIRLRDRLQELQPGAYRPASPPAAQAALARLERLLADSADQAFGAGLGAIAAQLEGARARAAQAAEAAASATASEWADAREFERTLWERVHRERELLLQRLAGPVPSFETLPDSLRGRYATRSGRWLGFLYAGADLFEPAVLDEFVAASLRVSPEVTGFPQVFHKMAGRIVGGLERAVLIGGLLVFAILWFDFRSLRDAALASVPLAMGALWMIAAMRLIDLQFNLANLVGIPLILGIGIDNGVHVMRRVRLEGEAGIETVLRHTGRAILIASMTTMVGFGSLALASHRGMASLGQVLLIGVAACWLASTVVLPNLLLWVGRVRHSPRSGASRSDP